MFEFLSIFEAGSVIGLLVRATVVITGVLLLLRAGSGLWGRRSAATRHLLWLAGLLVAVTLPLVVLTTPLRWGESRVPRLMEVLELPTQTSVTVFEGIASETTTVMLLDGQLVESLTGFALLAWLTGVLAVLSHLLLGMVRLRGLVRSARGSDVARVVLGHALPLRVRVVESARVPFPIAAGLIRPVIVLPDDAGRWPATRLRYALLHELAHVQRRDVLWQTIARGACALNWFNPLVWIASKRCAAEAERACGDAVLAAGVRPSAYAGHLLEVARRALRGSVPAGAVGSGTELEGRISAVLRPGRVHRGAPRRALASAVLLAIVCAIVAGTHRSLAESRAPALDANETQRHDVTGALLRLLEDEDVEVRAAAVRSAGQLNLQTAIPRLISALADPAENVRERAAHALGDLEAPAAIAALQHSLLSDRSSSVRREAAAALGEIETGEAAAALGSALGQTTDRSLRRQIVRALGKTGSAAAVPLLEPLVGSAGDLTAHALQALTSIEAPAARRAMIRAMHSDHAQVRRLAARAIAGER